MIVTVMTNAEPAQTVAPISGLCEHFHECGGCPLQDQTPAEYRARKIQTVLAPFARDFPDLTAENIQKTFIPFGKRRRTTISAFLTEDQYVYGYKQARSHKIFSLRQCGALTPRLEKSVIAFGTLLKELIPKDIQVKIEATDCENGVDLRVRGAPEISRKRADRLRERLTTEQPEIIRLCWSDTVMHQTHTPIIRLSDGVTGAFQPGVFLQPSREGQEILQSLTQAALTGLRKKQQIADLFCGAGVLGLPFAEKFGVRVSGFDSEKTAETLLRQSLSDAGLQDQYHFKCRDLFRDPLSEAELKIFDAVLVNPPRQGAQAQSEKLARSGVKKIVMISCNPQTAARDGAILARAGYIIKRFDLLDQFPFTDHCECVISFEKSALRR